MLWKKRLFESSTLLGGAVVGIGVLILFDSYSIMFMKMILLVLVIKSQYWHCYLHRICKTSNHQEWSNRELYYRETVYWVFWKCWLFTGTIFLHFAVYKNGEGDTLNVWFQHNVLPYDLYYRSAVFLPFLYGNLFFDVHVRDIISLYFIEDLCQYEWWKCFWIWSYGYFKAADQ